MESTQPTETRKAFARLALGALGVVFGDIGTSPLYALKECVSKDHGVPPSPDNVLGVLSHVNIGVVPSTEGSAKVATVKLARLPTASAAKAAIRQCFFISLPAKKGVAKGR